MYYAHIRDDGAVQSVEEHLTGTAERSGKFAESFAESRRGQLLGMVHDIGKNSEAFQKRLNGGPKVDHATAGAIECAKIGEMLSGVCVIGHHGGLPDYGSQTDPEGMNTYIGRLKKGLQGGIPPYEFAGKLENKIPMPRMKDGFSLSLWVRMLYSCLVDADYLDTEAFMSPKQRQEYDSLSVLLERLEKYIAPWFPAKTQLNEYRCQILKQCFECAEAERGIFSLTVPTGGGKTVASLAFGLKHAIRNGMERIIYVIPYTSIIEQNAQVFRNILGERNVVEHHSGVGFDNDEETLQSSLHQRLASENWDAPVIVTTAVQFFESLYSNRPSQCRKLHNIANSVIIFDEAQMIPGCHLKPCVGVISQLVSHFKATAVLCTATQPVLDDLIRTFSPELKATEICPQVGKIYNEFRRVRYNNGGIINNAELGKLLAQNRQVLCIVNTRKTAQEIFSELPEEGRVHLSTLMYPKHRKDTLDIVRQRLRDGKTCRVVSTSLIEAGVDVDFPAVYRQMAGLDSLIQAAGRCNREGKRPMKDSVVTYFEGEDPTPPLQRINIGAAREALAGDACPDDPETVCRYFSAWRSLNGDNLDKSGAVEHLKNGISGCLLPFRSVAEGFRYIDQATKTVYIPTEEAEEVLKRIADGVADRRDYRTAGQYSVNIYEQHYHTLISAGDVQALDDDSGILVNMGLYDRQTGLSLKADTGKAEFI